MVGYGGFGLSSGVSRALGGIGYEIWNAAKLDAQAWAITWLPPMLQSRVQRIRLENRGIAPPQIRKNIDTR